MDLFKAFSMVGFNTLSVLGIKLSILGRNRNILSRDHSMLIKLIEKGIKWY